MRRLWDCLNLTSLKAAVKRILTIQQRSARIAISARKHCRFNECLPTSRLLTRLHPNIMVRAALKDGRIYLDLLKTSQCRKQGR